MCNTYTDLQVVVWKIFFWNFTFGVPRASTFLNLGFLLVGPLCEKTHGGSFRIRGRYTLGMLPGCHCWQMAIHEGIESLPGWHETETFWGDPRSQPLMLYEYVWMPPAMTGETGPKLDPIHARSSWYMEVSHVVHRAAFCGCSSAFSTFFFSGWERMCNGRDFVDMIKHEVNSL